METEKDRIEHRIKPDFRKLFRFIKCPFPGGINDACNYEIKTVTICNKKNQMQLFRTKKREFIKDENQKEIQKGGHFLSTLLNMIMRKKKLSTTNLYV